MMPERMTDKVRWVMVALFAFTTVAALVGWFFHRDVTQLTSLIQWQALGVGIGEASNVGKRATSKADVITAETQARLSGAYPQPKA